MKKLILIVGVITLLPIISCNFESKRPINTKAVESLTINDTNVKKNNSHKDSVEIKSRPTYQDIYSEEWKRGEIIGKLKHDPSTKIKDYNYQLNDQGNKVNIELYHIKDRIVLIEKRTFDKINDQLKLDVYDFSEDNSCNAYTIWTKKEMMSYIYTMHWDSLIMHDVNCNKIDLNSAQKQKIIQTVKVSLDSIMQHFPEFNYTFNWK